MRARRISPMVTLGLAAALVVPGVSAAGPDEPAHGVTSANVEHVSFVPFEVGTATGMRIVGGYMYLTSWKNISIYDVSDPLAPELVSVTPLGFRFENEDVATNGEILLFSESLPGNVLHVWDVSDKTAPVEIGSLSGAGNHTTTCVYDCEWAYGSSGAITDLRDPSNPKSAGSWTGGGISGSHDLIEVRPGLVLLSNSRGQLLDTTDPTDPKLIAQTDTTSSTPSHSIAWPRAGMDRFIVGQNETNATGSCGSSNGRVTTWDTTGWEETGLFRLVDVWRAVSGTTIDGSPPANGLGCSAHWFTTHPQFHDGGLVAMGYYEHGTRFFNVGGAGGITEVGFFLPHGGSTSAAYWVTDRLVYSIDYTRGIDILRWNGPIPTREGDANAVTALAGTAAGAVEGTATFQGETDPFVIAEDPAGDGVGGDVSSQTGVDITEVSVQQPDAGYPMLVFRFKVTDLPFSRTGLPPEVERLTISFRTGIGGAQWFVQAKSTAVAQSTIADDPAGHVTEVGRAFQLRGNCQLIGGVLTSCGHVAWLDGAFDVANDTVSIRVPVGSPAAAAIASGVTLVPATSPSSTADIYAAYQVVADNNFTRDIVTWEQENTYTVPARAVRLGVAPEGTDPASVTYVTEATLAADGSFTGAVGSVPAGSAVFARACFGTSCAYSSVSPS